MATSQFNSHQVDILYNSDFDDSPICAGTLISSYLVLTVFSCLVGKNETKLKVRAPSGDTSGNPQIRNVSTFHSFPALKREFSENDIAVILLDTDFEMDESLEVINIIEHDADDPEELFAMSPPSSSSSSSSSCGKMSVERTDQSDCNRRTEDPNLICVKLSHKSSCPFPLVGSGLICQVHGSNFLCGALAGNGTTLGAYTDISKYLYWIHLTFSTRPGKDDDADETAGLGPTIFQGHEVSSSGVSTSTPYQLSLQDKHQNRWRHICGAIIIDTKTALTAAHCFDKIYKGKEYRVVAGVTHLNSNSSTKQTLSLKRIIRHPDYKTEKWFKGNDIAVIHVNGSFVYNENVRNIWISPPQEINSTDLLVRMSGWGKVSQNGEAPNSLQEVEMRILSDFDCKRTWTFLLPSMICSYDNISNTCDGDSGGPLVVQNYQFNQNTTRDLLVGIGSFSPLNCEQRDEPNGFTEVSHFMDWIREKRGLKCGGSEFQCSNGECIDECSLCNGADDCGDGSDEQEKHCPVEISGARAFEKLRTCLRKKHEELNNLTQSHHNFQTQKTQELEELRKETRVAKLRGTDTNETTSPDPDSDSGVQDLMEKYGNGTKGATEFIESLNRTLHNLERTEEEFENLKESLSVQAERVRELERERDGLKNTERDLRTSIQIKDGTINTLNAEKRGLESTERQLRTSIQAKDETISSLNAEKGRLERTERQLTTSVQTKDGTINSLNAEKMRLESTERGLRTSVQTKDETIRSLNAEKMRLERTETELRGRIRTKDETIRSLNKQVKNLTERPNCPSTTEKPTTTTTNPTTTTTQRTQGKAVGVPAAAAMVFGCIGNTCDPPSAWQYKATYDGNCKNSHFVSGIHMVQITGSCVTVYEKEDCKGEAHQVNTESAFGDRWLQHKFQIEGKPGHFTGPKSIGICLTWI